MSEGEILNRVASRLLEIEGLERGKRADAADELIQTRSLLAQAEAECAADELPCLEGLNKRFLVLAAPVADELLAGCERLLVECAEDRIPSDPQQLEREVGHALGDMERIGALLPDRLSDPVFLEVRSQLELCYKRVLREQRLRRVEDELGELWQRAERLEATSEEGTVGEAIRLCQQAVEKAQLEPLDWAEWEPAFRDRLQVLRGEARRRWNGIRDRHEVPITKLEGDQLIELIVDFAARKERNAEELVTYFTSAEQGAVARPMEVSRAVEIARARLVQIFWKSKVDKYVADADACLSDHRPRDAMTVLVQWESLPGLGDPRLGVEFPEDFKARIRRTQERIQPELNQWLAAEAAASSARMLKASDPLLAYERYQKASEAYPHYAEWPAVQKEILDEAGQEISRLIIEAKSLIESEEWLLCASRLKRIKELVALDRTLNSRYQDEITPIDQVCEEVRRLKPEEGGPVSLDQEIKLLEGLQARYQGDYWPRWPKLQRRLGELRARSNLLSLKADADRLCTSGATLAQLERLHRDCEHLRAHPPMHLSKPDRGELGVISARIEAWIGAVKARDELQKVVTGDGTDPGQEFSDPPDLSVAAAGIQAAKRDLEATEAVRALGLDARLRRLQDAEPEIDTVLGEARQHLFGPTLAGCRTALAQITYWLRRPSTRRADLLDMRRQLGAKLLVEIETEIRSHLDNARKQWYAQLDGKAVQKLLQEASRVGQASLGAGTGSTLDGLTAGPLAAAAAHALERSVERGSITWEKVKEGWERGAQPDSDTDLAEYCRQRARQAHKRAEFRRARAALNSEDAARILSALCQDNHLQHDWEAWLEHGRHSLKSSQEVLREKPPGEQSAKAGQLLSTARDSLNRAHRLTLGSPELQGQAVEVRKALSELDLWAALVEAQRKIALVLETPAERLTAEACKQAVTRCEDGIRSVGTEEPARMLEGFWTAQRARARGRLERQAGESGDVLEKLESWLGVYYLFPDDQAVKTRLERLTDDARQSLQSRVRDAVFDASAERFLRRYATAHSERHPDHSLVAGLQLAEARRLLSDLQQVRTLVGILSSGVVGLAPEPDTLDSLETELKDWENQLVDLQRALDQAWHLAQLGLSSPERFDVARYILAQEARPVPGFDQVPQTFRDRGHPSFNWYVKEVGRLEAKRKRQEELKAQIEYVLKQELVARPEDLPMGSADVREREWLEALRSKLQTPLHAIYPIEEVLRLMVQMREEAPNDDCGLQSALVYVDPEAHNQRYVSLAAVLLVIERKVSQVHTLRNWLSQFVMGRASGLRDCPGVVDWEAEKARIAKLRDRDKKGLMQAHERCYEVLGDGQSLRGPLWSLTKARGALSRQQMFQHLNGLDGQPEDAEQVQLCAVARAFDGERAMLEEKLNGQIGECENMKADIKRRIDNYGSSWDRFVQAQQRLLRLRKNWGSSEQWLEFQAAAAVFCRICPAYDEFQRLLGEVYSRTGLRFQCPEKG